MFGTQGIPRDLDGRMKDPVKLKIFTTMTSGGYRQCPACENTVSLLKELARASDKVQFEEISILEDKESAERWKVSRAPTIIITGHGIRYTGAPIGMETAPFVYTLIMASTGKTIFSGMLGSKLDSVRKARLELIVTPTCPYCAQAALIENSLVMESAGKLAVDVVESYENPDIARKYNVTGVPVTVFNGNPANQIVGVPTLAAILARIT
nr:thioredoxin family protein [Candidatus Sigynarchaeum springense]MDO8119670.1 thioredoxin family protein [Candidatus Sigynarchaeota archaeon]